jgi:hypothetical protein
MKRTCMSVVSLVMGLLIALPQPIGAQQAGARPAQSSSLRIVVLAGEDAVNVIKQRTAVAPLVEVRDRNDQPVAGAVVTFSIQGGRASFAAGANTVTMTTNAAGQAAVAGLTPTGSGLVQINVAATFQGQAATTAITQTNFATAAQAASAGSAASGSSAGSSGGSGGGGIGAGTITGLAVAVAGAAGGLFAYGKYQSSSVSPSRAPGINVISSPAVGSTVANGVQYSITVHENGGNGTFFVGAAFVRDDGTYSRCVLASMSEGSSGGPSSGSTGGGWTHRVGDTNDALNFAVGHRVNLVVLVSSRSVCPGQVIGPGAPPIESAGGDLGRYDVTLNWLVG